MAALPGFQEKHIFKFNLRCLFSSSPSTPNCWQGPGFGSKAKMLGNCDHVKKALNNVAFWKCGDSSCLRAQFSAPVNMFGTFAAAEKKKVLSTKYSEKHMIYTVRLHSPRFNGKRKQENLSNRSFS